MIHIFDVDDTVIKNTSAKYFLFEAIREKYISFWQLRRLPIEYIKYKLGVPDADFIDKAVENFKNFDENEFERVGNNCFNNYIKKKIYREAIKLIKEAQNKGEKIIFATSSFDFIIKPLAEYLGIDEIIATKLEFKDGKTTGKLSGDSYFGEKKKTAVENWLKKNKIDPKETVFYSDSYSDIPLLEYCGSAVAVNPDRILRREAKKREWKILKFGPRITDFH